MDFDDVYVQKLDTGGINFGAIQFDAQTVIGTTDMHFALTVNDGDGDAYTSSNILDVTLIGGTQGSPFSLTGTATGEVFGTTSSVDTIVATQGSGDTVDYASALSGIRVDLSKVGTSQDALFTTGGPANGAAGDKLSGIENIIGSDHNDILLGDSLGNVLYGGNGGDILNGNGGDDVLIGGLGNNTLVGGTGNDTFKLTNLSGQDLIADFNNTTEADKIDLTALLKGSAVDTATISNYVSYNATTGQLSVDVDGAGSGATPVVVAVVNTNGGFDPATNVVTPGTTHASTVTIVYEDAAHAVHTTVI